VAQEEVVCDHDAHEWSQEDRKGAKNRHKGGGAVDQLPWLYNPSSEKSYDSTASDVDIPREDASQINATGNRVAANVLEQNCKCKGQGEEKDSSSSTGRALSTWETVSITPSWNGSYTYYP
jgi:hypothetical protein